MAEVTDLLRRGVTGRGRIPGKHGGPARAYAVVQVVIGDRPGELQHVVAPAAGGGRGGHTGGSRREVAPVVGLQRVVGDHVVAHRATAGGGGGGVEHVEQLGDRVAVYLDGGPLGEEGDGGRRSLPSTILTVWPRACNSRAATRPAMPAPRTRTCLRGLPSSSRLIRASMSATGTWG